METNDLEENKFIQKITTIAFKLGQNIYLQALKDAFSTLMPIFVLAGINTMLNSVLFPWILKGEQLVTAQAYTGAIGNATLNISGLLVAPTIAFFLSKHLKFNNPYSSVVTAISSLFAILPVTTIVSDMNNPDTSATTKSVVLFNNIGTQSMFAGIIVGIFATILYIRLTKVRLFEINLGENVPPQISKSFSALIPTMVTVSVFGLISFASYMIVGKDLITLIVMIIQEPLRKVNTSLPGFVFLYSFGNFLFGLGIHQGVVMNSILDPFLISNITDNMSAFQNGQEIPHILTKPFVTCFPQMGGTGGTISLLIAIFIFSKSKYTRNIAGLSFGPGLFNINEPLIFGIPIVFNLPLMIPFVLMPALYSVIGYYLTLFGLVSKTVVFVPWMTPPIVSGYLATGGDWRIVIAQIVLIILGVFIYLPFLKISDRLQDQKMGIKL